MKTKTFAPPDNFQPVAFVTSTKDSSISYIVWFREVEKRKDWGCTCGAFRFYPNHGPCKHMKLVFTQSSKLRKQEIDLSQLDSKIILTTHAKQLLLEPKKPKQKILFKIHTT